MADGKSHAEGGKGPGLPPVLGEGLLAPGTVRLFGRPFTGLQIGELGTSTTSNSPLVQQLLGSTDKSLARIYGFGYLGNYYKLPEPLVFLVFGPGMPVPSGFRVPEIDTGIIGTEQKTFDFDEGVRMWSCDQLDITVRVDIRIGWVKDLLLATEMTSDNNVTGGAETRRADMVARANLVGNANLIQRDLSPNRSR